jgi:copper homeostasis protein
VDTRTSCVLEICVDDPVGLRCAVAGGADRIELCSALPLGGLTPSAALVRVAVESGVPVHAMVRTRTGDFNYSEDEIALMADEVRHLRDMGVAGVVVGAADADGRLDERALALLREAAAGVAIVLHRVVDLAADPRQAVRLAVQLGYDYVLTSGGALQALDGRERIRQMVEEAAGGLTIIAGAGITPDNAALIIRDTGVKQIHASASDTLDWQDPKIERFGFAAGPRRLTSEAKVAELKTAIANLFVGEAE